MEYESPKKRRVWLRRLGVVFLIFVVGVGGAVLLVYGYLSFVTLPLD